MESTPSSRTWRWLALTGVLLNIFLNYWSNVHPLHGKSIGMVSNQYPVLFTPAGYAFSIWGVIYAALLSYIVYQLLPSQRHEPLYDRLAKPLTFISLFSIGWVISFSYEQISVSEVLIILMLMTAGVLFVRARTWAFEPQRAYWLVVPFSLYFGWLTVATIANTTVWLFDLGWQNSAASEIWAVGLIVIAFLLAIAMSRHFRDLLYPLVVAWASAAIGVARNGSHELVALAGWLAATMLLGWILGFGSWLVRRTQPTGPTK